MRAAVQLSMGQPRFTGPESPAGTVMPADEAVPMTAEQAGITPSITVSDASRRVLDDTVRAGIKRAYADFVALEGMSEREAVKFIDSVGDEDAASLLHAIDQRAEEDETMRATHAKLAAEIGAQRLARLEAYVRSKNTRDLVDHAAGLLDGRDVPLSAEFDQLVALSQPILTPAQMPVLIDLRDAMVESRRQFEDGPKPR